MSRHLLLIFMSLFFLPSLQAQESPSRTLWKQISRIVVLEQTGSTDSAMNMAMRLLPTAVEQNDHFAQLQLHLLIGTGLREQSKPQEALRTFRQAEKICEIPGFTDSLSTRDKNMVAHTYSQLAELCSELNMETQCVQYALKAAGLAALSPDNNLQASTLPMMGGLLFENKRQEEARPFLEQGFFASLEKELPGNALIAASYLMAIEDDTEHPSPDNNSWMRRCEMLLPLVSSDYPQAVYYSTASSIYLRDGDVYKAHEMQERAMALGAFRAIYTPEKTKEFIKEIEEEKGLQAAADTVSRPVQHTTDTAVPPLVTDIARNDSIQPRIEYIRIRNQRIGIIGGFLAIVILAFIAYFLWQQHRRRKMVRLAEQQTTESYIEGMESERSRMARELHDDVSNQLLAVEMKLNTDGTTEQALQLLSESRERIRRVSHELMPPEFRHNTLNDILGHYISNINGTRGCEVTYYSSPTDAPWEEIPEATALEVYRIVQEVLGNALKHSGATLIAVGMKKNGPHTTVTIADNGKLVEKATPDGIGLRTIEQRAKVIGATLTKTRTTVGKVWQLDFDC